MESYVSNWLAFARRVPELKPYAVVALDEALEKTCAGWGEPVVSASALLEPLGGEVAWLLKLADAGVVPQLKPFGEEARAVIEKIGSEFDVEQAARVKAIERTTNHDVKAVEYFLKEEVGKHIEAAGTAAATAAQLRGCRVAIDWHTLGYTVLATNPRLGENHWLVRVARAYERWLAPMADAHFCVTRAMREFLRTEWGIGGCAGGAIAASTAPMIASRSFCGMSPCMALTVKFASRIFDESQSTFLFVLQKMTACVIVSVSYRSHLSLIHI